MSKTLSPLASNTSATWGGLRRVIADTPGFQHWCNVSQESEGCDLDRLIQTYLSETLETLAY
jgi:hypothetical protein